MPHVTSPRLGRTSASSPTSPGASVTVDPCVSQGCVWVLPGSQQAALGPRCFEIQRPAKTLRTAIRPVSPAAQTFQGLLLVFRCLRSIAHGLNTLCWRSPPHSHLTLPLCPLHTTARAHSARVHTLCPAHPAPCTPHPAPVHTAPVHALPPKHSDPLHGPPDSSSGPHPALGARFYAACGALPLHSYQ